MNLTFKAGVKYFFLFILGILAVYLVFKDQNPQKIFSSIKNANYFWVTLSAAMVLLAHYVRAMRWKMLIEALGKPINLNTTFYALMVGYLANLVFPRLGEVSRCGALNKKVNFNFTQLFGTVITERLVDLISLIIVALLTIIIQYQLIFNFLNQLIGSKKINTLEIFIAFCLIACIVYFVIYLFKNNKNHSIVLKTRALIANLVKGLLSIIHLKNKLLFIFYTVLIWALYILSVYVAFFALQATQNLGIAAAFCVIVFGSLGMIAPVQGGIGTFHFMVTKALAFYKINEASGLSLATLMHTSQAIIIIVIGIFSLLMIFKKRAV